MKSNLSLSVLGLFIAAFASVTSLPPPPPINGPFLNCSSGFAGPEDMDVTKFVLEPYPPCTGKEVCIVANGTLSAPIYTGGKLNIIGRYIKKIVYTEVGDLMDGLVAQGYPSPVPMTATSIKYCFTVNTALPIGVS